MEFDYDYYRRALFIGEIIMLVVGLYLLISFIILVLNRKFISYNMFKKNLLYYFFFSFFILFYNIFNRTFVLWYLLNKRNAK